MRSTTSNSISADPWATVPLASARAWTWPRVNAALLTQFWKASSDSQWVTTK